MFNKSKIMYTAWDFVKANRSDNMSDALVKAWHNAKTINAISNNGVLNSWYGWKEQGREVIHGSKCIAQATLFDVNTKNGTRVVSYFSAEQTCLEGEQE